MPIRLRMLLRLCQVNPVPMLVLRPMKPKAMKALRRPANLMLPAKMPLLQSRKGRRLMLQVILAPLRWLLRLPSPTLVPVKATAIWPPQPQKLRVATPSNLARAITPSIRCLPRATPRARTLPLRGLVPTRPHGTSVRLCLIPQTMALNIMAIIPLTAPAP